MEKGKRDADAYGAEEGGGGHATTTRRSPQIASATGSPSNPLSRHTSKVLPLPPLVHPSATTPRRASGSTHAPRDMLTRCLQDAQGYQIYLAYAQSAFSAENVLFWSAVNAYRDTPSIAHAREVYNTYIDENAPLQVQEAARIAACHSISTVCALHPCHICMCICRALVHADARAHASGEPSITRASSLYGSVSSGTGRQTESTRDTILV